MSDIIPTDEEYESGKQVKAVTMILAIGVAVAITVFLLAFEYYKHSAGKSTNRVKTNVVQKTVIKRSPNTWLTRIIYEAPGGVIKTNDVYEGEEACWTIGNRLMIIHGKNNVEYIVSPRIHVFDHDPH